MKKWLLAAGLGLALATSAQAADKIAIVNMGSLFQQVAQKTGVSNTLENEFKGRASELQRMETDLQAKMKKLQSMKAGSDRTKLEKDDLVVDANAVAYNSSDVKDITADVLKQVK